MNFRSIFAASAALLLSSAAANAAQVAALIGGATIAMVDTAQKKVTGSVKVTGISGALVGIDVRPADGMLYGLVDDGTIVTIAMDGKATMKSKLDTMLAKGVAATVDFNPVADRLRVMGADGMNLVGLARGTKPWLDPKTRKAVARPLYNDITFHRVIPQFMIQTGDPTATGRHDCGFFLKDEIVPVTLPDGSLSCHLVRRHRQERSLADGKRHALQHRPRYRKGDRGRKDHRRQRHGQGHRHHGNVADRCNLRAAGFCRLLARPAESSGEFGLSRVSTPSSASRIARSRTSRRTVSASRSAA